ncbi:MAG TPA: hypothetical protein VFZ37_10295 [Jiangellaceae bacterium]
MSDQTPDRAEPPYPGWSAQQPPERRAGPGQDAGWQRPGGSYGPSGTHGDAGSTAGHGGQQGWGSPDRPDTPSSPGQQGWGTPPGQSPEQGSSPTPQWSWAQPKIKPGVIPLRPLGVGEILDGAVTTIRKNLGAMLGLSVVVAVLIQLGALYFSWTMFDALNELSLLPATASEDQVLGLFSDFAQAGLVTVALEWLGRTILTGILTVVVSRAVLGEHMTAGEAWRRARPRLLRLLALTIVYLVIVLGPLLLAGGVLFALTLSGDGGAIALGVLLFIAAIPVTVWLAIRYVLATPIVMIETIQPANGAPVPIGIAGSLRRSAELVRTSWWRVFGIYLLIVLIAYIIANAMSFTVSLPAMLADPAEGIGFGAVLLIALGGVLATAVTAPFVAGSVALLYVDRRIRAEGLDIELARAAGVTIPGRTDVPPGGPTHGPGRHG